MHYKVTISRRAENNLEVLYEYLNDNWPDKVRIDFIKSLKKEVDYLRVNPYINQKSDLKRGIRRSIITKHNILYYRILDEEVEIITIQDSRMNPKSFYLL